MQVDVVFVLAHAAAFADFHRHTARNNVTAGKVFVGGGIPLHKAFAFGVGQIPAFATRAFGDQTARAIDSGGVELHEFHILQRQPRTRRHTAAVAGAGMRRCRREIGTAIATCRQNNHLGAEQVHGAVVQLPAQHTLTHTIIRHDQINGEILDVEFRAMLQRLTIKRVQNRVAGPVGGGTGPLHGGAFAEFGGVAAEGALVDLARFGPRERHAVVFKLVHRFWGFACEVFHRIGVTQPVRALDRVIHMPLPVIGAHVGQRRRDTALRRNRVRTGRENFGHAGCFQPLLCHAKCRTQASAASPHDNDIIFMRFIFICSHVSVSGIA